jgi:hypothetical protein
VVLGGLAGWLVRFSQVPLPNTNMNPGCSEAQSALHVVVGDVFVRAFPSLRRHGKRTYFGTDPRSNETPFDKSAQQGMVNWGKVLVFINQDEGISWEFGCGARRQITIARCKFDN